MIFITVGAQLPFDRLVLTVDEWAGRTGRQDIFAQIADGTRPQHFDSVDFLEPAPYRERMVACDVVIAHAGMGSILTALECGKPILVLPRRGSLGETRNDHQVATAERLGSLGKVTVAIDEAELLEKLDRVDQLSAAGPIGNRASTELIDRIRGFLGDVDAGRV
ncbi:MAG: glucuronosyltransferase [Planctomycetes bacterium]|nr:glucuronosyltransferase [Planctomycetota bacterium]